MPRRPIIGKPTADELARLGFWPDSVTIQINVARLLASAALCILTLVTGLGPQALPVSMMQHRATARAVTGATGSSTGDLLATTVLPVSAESPFKTVACRRRRRRPESECAHEPHCRCGPGRIMILGAAAVAVRARGRWPSA